MINYVRFKTLSTGYPTYKSKDKYPIDLLGSNGVYRLDGRLSLDSMINKAFEVMDVHESKNQIVGFEIIKAHTFLDDGKIIYKYIDSKKVEKLKGQ